jgi:hypothetical protein
MRRGEIAESVKQKLAHIDPGRRPTGTSSWATRSRVSSGNVIFGVKFRDWQNLSRAATVPTEKSELNENMEVVQHLSSLRSGAQRTSLVECRRGDDLQISDRVWSEYWICLNLRLFPAVAGDNGL